MKLDIKKRDLELLYEDNNIDKLYEILNTCGVGKSYINVVFSNLDYMPIESRKSYIVSTVMNQIRTFNKEQELKNFIACDLKLNFKNLKLKRNQKKYISLLKDNVSEKVYEKLAEIFIYKKDEYFIGIHRTNADVDTIFEEGIKYDSLANLTDHVQIMDDFVSMLGEISLCENYKQSEGCFIIKIPKNFKNQPIYYENNNCIYLNPAFIQAYVPVVGKKILPLELNESVKSIDSNLYEGDSTTNILNSSWINKI